MISGKEGRGHRSGSQGRPRLSHGKDTTAASDKEGHHVTCRYSCAERISGLMGLVTGAKVHSSMPEGRGPLLALTTATKQRVCACVGRAVLLQHALPVTRLR